MVNRLFVLVVVSCVSSSVSVANAAEKVSYEFAVGAGRFVSEQKWDGK